MFTLCIEKANMHHIKALKPISKQPFNVSLSPSVMWLLSQQDDNQNETLPMLETEETKHALSPLNHQLPPTTGTTVITNICLPSSEVHCPLFVSLCNVWRFPSHSCSLSQWTKSLLKPPTSCKYSSWTLQRGNTHTTKQLQNVPKSDNNAFMRGIFYNKTSKGLHPLGIRSALNCTKYS